MSTGVTTNSLITWFVAQLNTDASYVGIGTGVAPTSISTLLAGEQYRKLSDKFIDGNIAVFEGFWDETQANGLTYTNAGVFGNGETATLGTGQLFAGGAINIPKTSTQSMTVSVEISVEAVN